MRNPWLALEAGADPATRAGEVRRAHERFLDHGTVHAPVREVIAESWRRCAGARVEPEGLAHVVLGGDELSACRAEHPLAPVMPLIRELLGTIADDGAQLLSVCDAAGRLLWVEGHPRVLRAAERMNFVPGARWSESFSGTNAPGTALAVDHPVQIFAAEHYCRPVQPWTCAAAPVHDPRTHRVIGAIDITGGDHLASPQSLALVQATARAAEAHLAQLARPRAPRGPALAVLGREEALVHRDAPPPLRLPRRQSEILLLLATHPEGLTGERLALELYGEREVNPVTLRAELSRLRQVLGPLVLSRPYRLAQPLTLDCDLLTEALRAGDLAAALAVYRGPPLPCSEAPGVLRLRGALEDRLRRAVLSARDRAPLETWVRTPWGESDLAAWEALLVRSPETDPLRGTLAARVTELRHAYGLGPAPGRPGGLAPAPGVRRSATYPQRPRP
ncbi:GAF domain-containing protein [Streptomyces sp. AJS327]|uniref:GAF domain-containing protein n=1 Tax=Streptomyces sp. AJS327 TaxID=2545265 RepID=UPI0015DD7E78|nr:GAF domain-containing protein [Streptomyces sp. AJS327]MBA0052589.1 GAF domain-containing protein [Streptomyces sp. AJS327]